MASRIGGNRFSGHQAPASACVVRDRRGLARRRSPSTAARRGPGGRCSSSNSKCDFRGAAQPKPLADLPPHEACGALEGARGVLARVCIAEAGVEDARVLQVRAHLHARTVTKPTPGSCSSRAIIVVTSARIRSATRSGREPWPITSGNGELVIGRSDLVWRREGAEAPPAYARPQRSARR